MGPAIGGAQTVVSFLVPLRRRAFTILRPALLFMRARKPDLRFFDKLLTRRLKLKPMRHPEAF